jgi:hypothetical protein
VDEPERPERRESAAAHRLATPNHPSHRRIARGAAGGRLRGHLVPHSLHADARRSKVAQQARRGHRVTWDDVATEAVQLLLDHRDDVVERLAEVRRVADAATATPRLVQATIPSELDDAFTELRLDLADDTGHDVPYEQLWAAALLMWMRTHR